MGDINKKIFRCIMYMRPRYFVVVHKNAQKMTQYDVLHGMQRWYAGTMHG